MTTLDHFEHDNVVGQTLTLLERTPEAYPQESGALHLDLGRGIGALAEPLTTILPVTYVGLDLRQEGVDALHERGFEAHRVELADRETFAATLRQVVGDRRVASISVLGLLQTLPADSTALLAVRDLAKEHDAVVVVSVPAITHVDIGFKLAFGRWDVTDAGALAEDTVQHFDRQRFERTLHGLGLYSFHELDVVRERSEQHFPLEHPALSPATSLGQFLLGAREVAAPDARTSHFVWLCTSGPVRAAAARDEIETVAGQDDDRPFLSVVTRTQGNRPECLAEVLTSMAAQTDSDFEVLVVGHRLTPESLEVVERVMADQPRWMQDKVRLLRVERGRRTAPLNEGFAAARGHYIAILDDDDIPFAHWVQVFRELSERAPGRVLRTVSVIQDSEMARVDGRDAVRAAGWFDKRYPSSFDFLDHLRMNFTPNTALAFPRGVFHDLNIHFDESLTTTEDWDFIVRTTSMVGVVSSPEVTCVYRWWLKANSSRTEHDLDEWNRNQQAILRKLDERPLLLPAGSTARIRDSLNELEMLKTQRALHGGPTRGDQTLRVVEAVRADYELRLHLLREIEELLGSRCWRVSAPLRIPGRLAGRRPVRVTDHMHASAAELRKVLLSLHRSRSWRLTRILRGKN